MWQIDFQNSAFPQIPGVSLEHGETLAQKLPVSSTTSCGFLHHCSMI